MKKLVFISNMPAPYQVKFCYGLNKYFNTEFWFYDTISNRDAWWNIDLGERCKVIPKVKGKDSGRYITIKHLDWLNKFAPDIVILGGFSIPANYLAYRWAKRNNKTVVVATEVSRTADGVLREFNSGWKLLRKLYSEVDMVFALNVDAYKQFKDEFGFGEKVKQVSYAYDLGKYFEHPARETRENPPLPLPGGDFASISPHLKTTKTNRKILFANRLIPIYNPLGAIRIFYEVHKQYPSVIMKMNGSGELRGDCEELIIELQLQDAVSFLDHIPSWDAMHEVYRDSDILLLPANFSNGNFTIYEAMASGMGIVISNNVLSNGREIVNGENGFNLPLDERLFADKITEYIEHPGLITEHAEKNRKQISWLTVDNVARRYAELLG